MAQALCAIKNVNTFACLRQPSQGPTFGIKGKSYHNNQEIKSNEMTDSNKDNKTKHFNNKN